MTAYDSQLVELKNLLPTAKNILIALPIGSDTDKLAAGLALSLLLKQRGKQVGVVCEDTIKVSHAYLFGIDQVQTLLPAVDGAGNLTVTLEGVASPDGTVPSLEKLDWYAQNNNLNLVFHVAPGQTFQPTKIVPSYQSGGFNLIFVLGAANLNSLGNIYSVNQQIFSNARVINIDNQGNTSFGQINIIDQNAASISEVIAQLLSSLGLAIDADAATNLLAGIYESTANLSTPKVNADTFAAISTLMRSGGRKPVGSIKEGSGLDLSALIPKTETFTTAQNQPSPEERPVDEGVVTEAEPDWLVPKVFKGSSLG